MYIVHARSCGIDFFCKIVITRLLVFFSDDVLIVTLVFSFHYICVTAYVDSAALV